MTLRAAIWIAVSTEAQAKEDKVSLQEQERLCREFAEREGYEVTHVFRWDGYSRYETDLLLALSEFAEQGRYEYHQLQDMWRKNAFDVLVVFNDNRLARNQVVYTWVVANVIRSGARIYRIMGGWIDAESALFQTAMGGIAAVGEVERLVKNRRAAMFKRAENGLPTSSGVSMSHMLIRDELGKPIKQVVDESKRRLFDDLATLILEGIGWRQIEKELYARYGHVNGRGERWAQSRMYTMITNPSFWGHSARHYRLKERKGTFAWIGDWIFEAGHEIPAGVTIYYNTHEAVWTGELAERIKAEFRRRQSLVGSARPQNTRKFSGMLVCGECYHYLVTMRTGKQQYGLRCMSHYNVSATRPDCSQHFWVHEKKIQAWINARLETLLEVEDWSAFLDLSIADDIPRTLQQLADEIRVIEGQIDTLITEQSLAPSAAQPRYRQRIETLANQLGDLQQRQNTTLHQSTHQSQTTRDRERTLDELRQMTLAGFWKLSDREIHQHLHALFGNRRLLVLDGQIVFTVDAPKYKRRPK